MSCSRRFAKTRGPIALVTLNAFLSALLPALPARAQSAEVAASPESAAATEVGAAAVDVAAPTERETAPASAAAAGASSVAHVPEANEAMASVASAVGGGGVSAGALSLPGGRRP